MFAESLYAEPQGFRRGWTTLASFALEALFVAALLVAPLIYTQNLPKFGSVASLVLPVLTPAPPIEHPQARTPVPVSNFSGRQLMTPRSIPDAVSQIQDVVPPAVDFNGVGSATGVRGFPGGTASWMPVVPVAPPPAITHPARVSRMMEGYLVRKVEPVYPVAAKLLHIQGQVVVQAIISREGTIERVQVLSGNPILANAARQAITQWRYLPYKLNGDPVEVETQITVNFVMPGQ